MLLAKVVKTGEVKEVMETQEGKKEVEQVNIIRLCCWY